MLDSIWSRGVLWWSHLVCLASDFFLRLWCIAVSVVVWSYGKYRFMLRQVYGFMLWGLDRVSEHSHPRQDRKNILCEQELGNSASERLKLLWKLHTSLEHVPVARESSQAIYGNPHRKVVLKSWGIWESKCGQWKSLSVSLSLSCHALSFSSSLPYL